MQQLAGRLWPRGPHAGGLGWQAATGQLPPSTVLAEERGVIAGWACLGDGDLDLQADPASAAAASTLVEWAAGAAGASDMTIAAFDGDAVVRSALTESGFIPRPETEPFAGMFRFASPVRAVLPEGYRVRSVRDGELDARVQVHRAAWHPVTLPWAAGVSGLYFRRKPARRRPLTTIRFAAPGFMTNAWTW